MKETEYTDEELTFIYLMHNQAFYKRDNLQNPKTVEECQCTTQNPFDNVKYKKRLYSVLNDQ